MFVVVSQGGQEKTAEHVSSQVKYFKIIVSTYAHMYRVCVWWTMIFIRIKNYSKLLKAHDGMHAIHSLTVFNLSLKPSRCPSTVRKANIKLLLYVWL